MPLLETEPQLIIEISKSTLPKMQHAVSPLSQHTLILCAGRAVQMTQTRNGKHDRHIVAPGDIIVAPAWMDSLCSWDENFTMIHARISDQSVQQVATTLNQDAHRTTEIMNHFGFNDPDIAQLLNLLIAEQQLPNLGTTLYTDSLTTALIVRVLRQFAKINPESTTRTPNLSKSAVKRAIEYIHSNLHRDLKLDEIASSVHLSPYYFLREFKRHTGATPHQYLIEQRLQQAKSLLCSSELSVSEIAYRTGFYDSSHMARHIRNRFQVSPKELRMGKNLP